MSEHETVSALLSLAAAGVLSPDEERRVQAHVHHCADCGRELAVWRLVAAEVSRAKTEAVPDGLLERTLQRLTHVEGLRQESRTGDAILAFLMLFSWTVGAVTWLAFRLFAGGPSALASPTLRGTLMWIAVSTLLAWLTAGAAAVVLSFRARKGGTYELT
jgi:hypothetical protein